MVPAPSLQARAAALELAPLQVPGEATAVPARAQVANSHTPALSLPHSGAEKATDVVPKKALWSKLKSLQGATKRMKNKSVESGFSIAAVLRDPSLAHDRHADVTAAGLLAGPDYEPASGTTGSIEEVDGTLASPGAAPGAPDPAGEPSAPTPSRRQQRRAAREARKAERQAAKEGHEANGEEMEFLPPCLCQWQGSKKKNVRVTIQRLYMFAVEVWPGPANTPFHHTKVRHPTHARREHAPGRAGHACMLRLKLHARAQRCGGYCGPHVPPEMNHDPAGGGDHSGRSL